MSQANVSIRSALLLGIVILGITISGCKHYAAYVYSAVDPEHAPVKSDPIWLTLSTKPTIRERQLFVVLKSELAKNGFNIVETADKSRWVLALTAERRTYDFGITSSTTVVRVAPNFATATTRSHRNVVERNTIFLYLFDMHDFTRGKVLSIWEGSVSASENVYRIYVTSMFKNLLDVFGKNYERSTRLSKDYVKEGLRSASQTGASGQQQ